MQMKIKKLLDFYKMPRKNGIFFAMSQLPEFSALFSKLNMQNENDFHSMDFDYMFNHSGLKTVSIMLEQLMYGYIVDENGEYVYTPEGKKVTWDYFVTQIDQDLINMIIRIKFLDKWNNLADTLSYDYDPLNPFSMSVEENMSGNLTSKSTNQNNRTNKYTGNGSSENDGTVDTEGNSSSEDKIYGFNSTTGVNSDSSSDERTTKTTNKNTSSTEYTDDESSQYNSNEDYSRDNTSERNTTRKGNIGNLSAQQLIEQQRDMLKYQIFDIIYQDLDSVLTRSKYN